jgi:hypothetical protein
MKTTAGAQANKNGGILEHQVVPVLEANGYHKGPPQPGSKTYQTQVPLGETIYGSRRRVDFLLTDADGSRKVIECKYQVAGGSVDEKFPFLEANIRLTNLPTYVIHGGGGAKPGSLRWLAAQVSPRSKLRAVLSLSDFVVLANTSKW